MIHEPISVCNIKPKRNIIIIPDFCYEWSKVRKKILKKFGNQVLQISEYELSEILKFHHLGVGNFFYCICALKRHDVNRINICCSHGDPRRLGTMHSWFRHSTRYSFDLSRTKSK